MKVAFLTNNLNIKDGWGSYSFYLIEALKKEGVEPVILFAGKQGYFESKKLIKDCDIIHSLIEPTAFLGSLIRGNRPFFITAHGTYAVEPLDKICPSGLKLRYAYKKANVVICISHFTEGEIKKRMPSVKTSVVNNGVDFNKFQKLGISRPVILGNHAPIIFSVGALKSRKGYHVSIPAVAKLKENFPNLLYIISGDQSNVNYYNKLKRLIKDCNLENNVKFIEADDKEIIDLYHCTDVFLLTPINEGNHFEGFGLVYLEAGACGVSSVGSKGCGVEDAIKDGQTGFLVEQNNITKAAESVLKIIQNERLRQELGCQARTLAQSMSWETTAQGVLCLYQAALLK